MQLFIFLVVDEGLKSITAFLHLVEMSNQDMFEKRKKILFCQTRTCNKTR